MYDDLNGGVSMSCLMLPEILIASEGAGEARGGFCTTRPCAAMWRGLGASSRPRQIFRNRRYSGHEATRSSTSLYDPERTSVAMAPPNERRLRLGARFVQCAGG